MTKDADRFRPFETALDQERALAILKGATEGADDGELTQDGHHLRHVPVELAEVGLVRIVRPSLVRSQQRGNRR